MLTIVTNNKKKETIKYVTAFGFIYWKLTTQERYFYVT